MTITTRGLKGAALTYAEMDANWLAALTSAEPCSTVVGLDGSITETYAGGQTVTTTFPSATTMVRTFAGPVTGTITSTFNPDGSITEV